MKVEEGWLQAGFDQCIDDRIRQGMIETGRIGMGDYNHRLRLLLVSSSACLLRHTDPIKSVSCRTLQTGYGSAWTHITGLSRRRLFVCLGLSIRILAGT